MLLCSVDWAKAFWGLPCFQQYFKLKITFLWIHLLHNFEKEHHIFSWHPICFHLQVKLSEHVLQGLPSNTSLWFLSTGWKSHVHALAASFPLPPIEMTGDWGVMVGTGTLIEVECYALLLPCSTQSLGILPVIVCVSMCTHKHTYRHSCPKWLWVTGKTACDPTYRVQVRSGGQVSSLGVITGTFVGRIWSLYFFFWKKDFSILFLKYWNIYVFPSGLLHSV